MKLLADGGDKTQTEDSNVSPAVTASWKKPDDEIYQYAGVFFKILRQLWDITLIYTQWSLWNNSQVK